MIQLLRWWPLLAVFTGLYVWGSGWLAIFLYHGGILLALSGQKRPWAAVFEGFQPLSAADWFILGLGAAPIVAAILPWLLQMPVPEIKSILQQKLSQAGISGTRGFWLFGAYLCLPHPPLEELAWRGLLDVPSRRPHARDLEFASYHLLVFFFFFPGAWLFFVAGFFSLAAMGWIWRLMKISGGGGLANPVAFHAGGDLGVMLGLAWLMR